MIKQYLLSVFSLLTKGDLYNVEGLVNVTVWSPLLIVFIAQFRLKGCTHYSTIAFDGVCILLDK